MSSQKSEILNMTPETILKQSFDRFTFLSFFLTPRNKKDIMHSRWSGKCLWRIS